MNSPGQGSIVSRMEFWVFSHYLNVIISDIQSISIVAIRVVLTLEVSIHVPDSVISPIDSVVVTSADDFLDVGTKQDSLEHCQ